MRGKDLYSLLLVKAQPLLIASHFNCNISNSPFTKEIKRVKKKAYPIQNMSHIFNKIDFSGKKMNRCQNMDLKRKSAYINVFSLSFDIVEPASKCSMPLS